MLWGTQYLNSLFHNKVDQIAQLRNLLAMSAGYLLGIIGTGTCMSLFLLYRERLSKVSSLTIKRKDILD